ncbi:HNH endonuclease [Micromonospora sp. NPDC000663]|uniref:HNH endonuclease n=1 Tax=Micromonospora sp. NPDC000663 TaxID=3364218 RepID=UPI0036B7FD4D
MHVDQLTDRAAVYGAAEEHRQIGRTAFRERYGFGAAQKYWAVVDGQLHDAKAIVGAAYGYQYPERGSLRHDEFSGGETGANPDAKRTKEVDPDGVAVGVLHPGRHYADDLNDAGILYHYPSTNRAGKRDDSEILAMKRAAELSVPVFVISDPGHKSQWREVRLAWIEGWDDRARIFSLAFAADAPKRVLDHDDSDDQSFELFGNSSRREVRSTRERPGQPRFKLQVIQRYGAVCPLSGVTVPEMLEAVHLVPDADGGTGDPRNGLIMNAALHRAFDAGLFAIHPTTHAVEIRPGLTLSDLGVKFPTLVNLPKKPHPDALQWRYDWWAAKPKNNLRQERHTHA